MTKGSDAEAGGSGRSSREGREFGGLLGGMIRTWRRRKRWTQAELAEQASIDRNYLRAIELGKANPSLNVLIALAKALNVTIAVSARSFQGQVDRVTFPKESPTQGDGTKR
jgi:transcriptional regulator with XRE-family HTH domain